MSRGLLSRMRGRTARLRISMHADDAAIFIKPVEKDVRNLKNLLQQFGEVTGLCTNLRKTSVTNCIDVNLDTLLHIMPDKKASFPIK